jgi:type IV pilus assembly protein PilC
MATLLKNYLYHWSGKTSLQQKISGEIEAFSARLAKIRLRQQGITVLTIRRMRIKFSPKKLSAIETSFFFRQLATLIGAGIPLLQSFTILLASQQHLPHFTRLILTLKKDIESGKTLANALRSQHYFDNLSQQLIHIAEQTGTLQAALTSIANHQEKHLIMSSRLRQALLYPAIILLTAIVVTVIMLVYVIPQFASLFENFHANLPAPTRFIIHVSDFLRHRYYFLLLPVLLILTAGYFHTKIPQLKIILDKSLLRLPGLCHLSSKFIFARFARTFATVLAAGLPAPQGLSLIIDVLPNHLIKSTISQLKQDIIAGKSLHASMRALPWFPPLLIQMVKVGEESGQLTSMLVKVAEFYEAELDGWVNNFSHLLEPLIIMILGVLIGGLVIAMYLPIFKLGTVI